MNPLPQPLRWAALGLAALLGIGSAALLPVLAENSPPVHAPSFTDNEAEWEIDPRRPC